MTNNEKRYVAFEDVITEVFSMRLREELNYLLHEKAGEISMCWSDVDKAGTFDSSKAISIVEEALTAIEKLIEKRENELYLKWMKNMFKQDYITRQEAYERSCGVFYDKGILDYAGIEEALRTAFKIPEGKE